MKARDVTRFEVIDATGRAYTARFVSITMSYQDDGRTLKVMVRPRDRRALKARSQIKNPITGTWTKRDDSSGKFMDVKADPKPFKGVRREK